MGALTYYASVLNDNNVYVSNSRIPELYRINLLTGKTEYLGDFTGVYPDYENVHFMASKIMNKLYFWPNNNKYIDVYDMESSLFEKIEIPIEGEKYTVIGSVVLNDNIFIFPRYYNQPAWRMSIKDKGNIKKIDLKFSHNSEHSTNDTMALRICNIENKVYCPICDTNRLVYIDLLNEKEETILFNEGIKLSGDIITVEDDLWIGNINGIIIWNPVKGIVREINNCITDQEGSIEKLIRYKNKIVVVPHWYGNAKIIDINSLEKTEAVIDKEKLYFGINNPWRDTKEAFIWNDKLIINPVRYKEAIEIDMKTLDVNYRSFDADICNFEKLTGKAVLETEGDLDSMLSWIKKGEKNFLNKDCKYNGEKIWHAI